MRSALRESTAQLFSILTEDQREQVKRAQIAVAVDTTIDTAEKSIVAKSKAQLKGEFSDEIDQKIKEFTTIFTEENIRTEKIDGKLGFGTTTKDALRQKVDDLLEIFRKKWEADSNLGKGEKTERAIRIARAALEKILIDSPMEKKMIASFNAEKVTDDALMALALAEHFAIGKGAGILTAVKLMGGGKSHAIRAFHSILLEENLKHQGKYLMVHIVPDDSAVESYRKRVAELKIGEEGKEESMENSLYIPKDIKDQNGNIDIEKLKEFIDGNTDGK